MNAQITNFLLDFIGFQIAGVPGIQTDPSHFSFLQAFIEGCKYSPPVA